MPRIVDYPRKGKRGIRRFIPSWKLVLATNTLLIAFGLLAFAYLYNQVEIPKANGLAAANASIVYWADGKTEMGRFNDAEANRRTIPFEQIPDPMRKAIMAAEDRTFYTNPGFSPKGVARGIWSKAKGGSLQGGSTITQQYVKNYFLTQDQTFTRKAKELVISLKVEQQQDKDTILANYLNTIYFGRGAYGIETASQAYFGIPASKLSVGQSALLASVIRSPTYYDPVKYPEKAKARVGYVLDGMVEEGWLTAEDRAKVLFPKVNPVTSTNRYRGTTGYLMIDIKKEVLSKTKLTEDQLDRGGYKIVSTFEPKLQAAAVKAAEEQVDPKNVEQVKLGLASIRPATGEVVAIYGGPDAITESFNHTTLATLQGGSTSKPFTLAAALEQGISLDTMYDGNGPFIYDDGKKAYNQGKVNYGQTSLLEATVKSVNTVFLRLNKDVTPAKTREIAVKAGYPESTQAVESNVLGTSQTRVLDIAQAYATIANGGKRVDYHMVKRINSESGEPFYRAKPKTSQAFSADVAADVSYALQEVVTPAGTGKRVNAVFNRPGAGKTGTTNDSKSILFAGYTPELATAVGIYRQGPNGSSISLDGYGDPDLIAGGGYAGLAWADYMNAALDGVPEGEFPDRAYVGGRRQQERPQQEEPAQEPSPLETVPPTTAPSPFPTVPRTPRATPTQPPETENTVPVVPTEEPTEPDPTPTKTKTPRPSKTPPAIGVPGAGAG